MSDLEAMLSRRVICRSIGEPACNARFAKDPVQLVVQLHGAICLTAVRYQSNNKLNAAGW